MITFLLIALIAGYFYIGFSNFKKVLSETCDSYERRWYPLKAKDNMGEHVAGAFFKCFFWGIYIPYFKLVKTGLIERLKKER